MIWMIVLRFKKNWKKLEDKTDKMCQPKNGSTNLTLVECQSKSNEKKAFNQEQFC